MFSKAKKHFKTISVVSGLLLIAIGILIVTGWPHTIKGRNGGKQMAENKLVEVTDTNFEGEVLKSDIPVLVDFWAPWCGPCAIVAPAVEEIAKKYERKLKVCKLNVDEAPKTASEYSIMSIPTLAVFENGKMVEKQIGVAPMSKLESMIGPHLDKLSF